MTPRVPERYYLGLAALIAAVVLGAIFVAPYPPFQDFTEWLYQSRIAADLLRGIDVPGFALAHYPIPNSASQAVLAPLSLVMSPVWAGRLFLTAYLVAALLLSWALARRFHPALGASMALLLLISLFLNSPFWNGYANSAVGLLVFGLYLLLPEEKARRAGIVALFGLLTFFLHAVAFCAFAAVASWRMVARRRLDGTVIGLLPSLLLAAWYIAAKPHVDAHSSGLSHGLAHFIAYKAYSLAKMGPYHNFVFADGGDAVARPWLYWGGVAINFLYAAGMVVLLALGLLTARRTKALRPELAAAACLLLLFALLPDVMAEVVNPGERFFYPALLLLLLYLPLSPRLARALALCGVVMAASVTTLLMPHAWFAPVNDAQIAAVPLRVLFLHRPTGNAAKIAELARAARARDHVRLPLTFTSSFVVPGP